MNDVQNYPRVLMTRISGGNALRTDTVEGNLATTLTVGECITVIGESLDPRGSNRVVMTSPVVILSFEGNTTLVETQSGSVYSLTFQERG